jgi:uncharacterized protein YeaO (DUF488 family)
MEEAMLKLKRAYDPVSRDDGIRVLVERLWPRGLSKAKLRVERNRRSSRKHVASDRTSRTLR